MRALKAFIKSILKLINLYYLKPYKVPENTLLGMKELPIKTVIDIGANTGQFAEFISSTFPNAKIYCFEPLPEAFNQLNEWNKKGNVKIFNVALGDEDGEVDMNVHAGHDASSSLLNTTEVCETLYPETQDQCVERVRLSTLDNIMSDYINDIEQDMIIKLDVQGYEDRVIRGGTNTFKYAKCVIMEVSINKLYEGQASFIELVKLMGDLNFTYSGNLEQYYIEDGSVSFLDAVFMRNE